jgi:hypothetical protein
MARKLEKMLIKEVINKEKYPDGIKTESPLHKHRQLETPPHAKHRMILLPKHIVPAWIHAEGKKAIAGNFVA